MILPRSTFQVLTHIVLSIRPANAAIKNLIKKKKKSSVKCTPNHGNNPQFQLSLYMGSCNLLTLGEG